MMQVDPPVEEPLALLGQWYQVFLYAAMVPCFAAVVLSSLLMLYLEPLDEYAALAFIGVSALRSTRARPRGREPTAARRVRPMRERRRSSTFSASRRLR